MTNALGGMQLPTEPEGEGAEDLFKDIDRALVDRLIASFELTARDENAKMGEAMWALAMLTAKALTRMEATEMHVWAANMFWRQVLYAYPGFVLHHEINRRAREGRPPHDA